MDHISKLMIKCISSNILFLETITSNQTQFISNAEGFHGGEKTVISVFYSFLKEF